ncbi:PREDICTED: transmembrane protein 203-like [Lipotes vexillifer]|uniref:Transmembrane protein 203-like n=1 Tax=Lipotes vexillifer TaxID=118797 RepID=A0A340WHP5_LIPVE|nr:PREDICTED: transmembrane protein 203-like [Lipotes vexillifer]
MRTLLAPSGAWRLSKAGIGWRPVLGPGLGPRARAGRATFCSSLAATTAQAPARPVGSGGAARWVETVARALARTQPERCFLSALGELVQWLGFAPLEVFVHLMALSVFSVLLALCVDGLASGLSWWNVFMSFFAADRLSTNFTTVVSVRLFQDGEKRLAAFRLFWILTVLSLKFVFEMLLCQKLVEQTRELWFGLITSPVFILLQLLMVPACRSTRLAEEKLECGTPR